MVVQAKIWGNLVGDLFFKEDEKQVFFVYNDEFLNKGLEIAPVLMPTTSREKVFSFPFLNQETFKNLPPVFSDSLPDRFGNITLNSYLQTQGKVIDDLNPLERLTYIGERGIGALEYFPAQKHHSIYNENPLDLSEIIEIAKEVMQQKKGIKINSIEQILQIGTSAGGARPKIVIAKDKATNEFYAGDVLNKNKEVTYYLLKLDGTTDNQNSETSQYGKIEFAYYQLATLSGIEMSKTELLVENDRNHFLTQRFDRVNGQKLHSQTLNSIANLDYNNPLINSYEQCFSVMRKLNLSQSEIEQQFRRMVFNVMSKNLDDHTKNISFLMDSNGKWSLSPAYDLTHSYDPNNKWLKQHQMSINGKRNNIEYNDLIEVAKKQLIRNPDQIIQEVQEGVSNWIKIAKKLDIPIEKINKIEQSLAYNSIKPSIIKPNKVNEISSDEKVNKAIDFHLNNDYNFKINNLLLYGEAGALNKALKQNFEFVLNRKELERVYEAVKTENKNLKKGR